MGGRGAKSRLERQEPEPGAAQKIDLLEPILGPKGNLKNIAEILKRINPHHEDGVEYQENCASCVVALEAQFRGYDVEAVPIMDSALADSIAGKWRKFFERARSIPVGKRSKIETIQAMEKSMAQWGDGARAVVYVQWARGAAHVFNAVRINGQTHYFDGQIGSELDISTTMGETVLSETEIMRVDNLNFNHAFLKELVRRRQQQ